MTSYSSPCTFGIGCVGAIAGAGLGSAAGAAGAGGAAAWTVEGAVAAGFGAGAAGFMSTDADFCGATSGLPASEGFGCGSGTLRLARCGTETGGRASPEIGAIGGSTPGGP